MGINSTDAIEILAARLHWALEKYDPNDAPLWKDLDEHGREVCRATVRSLMCRRDAIIAALSEDSDNGVVCRHV